MKQSKQQEILLESGTNELEIMEFTINGELFGINVAKVREILRIAPLKPMQKAHPNIEGIFKPREKVITAIDLAGYLNLPAAEDPDRDIFIVTNFNNQEYAFHVHTVVGIDRISWEQLRKPDKVIYGGEDGVATGIAEHEGRLITLLDFEKIVSEISAQTGLKVADLEVLGERARNNVPILMAEDSNLLAKLIVQSLQKAGYYNIIKNENGQEAWDFLSGIRDRPGDILDHVACIITDIEMPQMDGHRLTKLVKSDPVLKRIPLVLFSSLISEDMRIKGAQLGADGQITKPEILQLVEVMEGLMEKSRM